MPEPFKNMFHPGVVAWYAQELADQPGFDGDAFQAAVLAELDRLELKDRVRLLADALHDHLSGDYRQDLAALLGLMGPPADLSLKNQFDFRMWPLTMYVQRFGLAHPTPSLAALYQLTQRFSGEFAIRPFLLHHREQTLATLHRWVEDDSAHVRRLVSEGSRTRLPWGERLQPFIDDPEPVLALVERLRADPHEYVRRSVANSLNDLAKDHPDRVVAVCARWRDEVPGRDMERLVARALRTLVKQGHPAALRLLGADPRAPVEVVALAASPTVVLGEALEVQATIANRGEEEVEVVLDLVLHLRKARGELSPKVFKWTRIRLGPGEVRAMRRRQPLRPVTTRRYHAGLHRVEVQVNGVVRAGADFDLVV